MIRNLFGAPATDEDICYIVFPGSGSGSVIDPALIVPRAQSLLAGLAKFDNALEVIRNLMWPNLLDTFMALQADQDMSRPDPWGQIAPLPNYVHPPSLTNLDEDSQFQNVMGGMRRGGFAIAP